MLLPIPDDVLQAQARDRMVDILLGSLGVTVAVVSASFAGYMVLIAPGGVVSQPGRAIVVQEAAPVREAVRTVEATGSMSAAAESPVDFTPTGSIAGTLVPRDGHTAVPSAVLPDFAVRDVFDDTAVIEAHGTLQVVRRGSVVDGAGEVLSIARDGDGWAVNTSDGRILTRR